MPEPYLLGYARVSKGDDQSNAAQLAAPKRSGCAQMVGAFAEFEWAMIRERTSAGLAQARAEGQSAAGAANSETSSGRRSQRACFPAEKRWPRWPGFTA